MLEEDKKNKNDLKSEIAQQKPRNEEGHFIHVNPPKDPRQPTPHQNPMSKFFSKNTHYSKGKDDLLDVHVGNPLHKITQLLEDIKKQKAFSFTLKGSLGLAGVALALGIFGIFGGGQILCEKGTQVQIGTIKQLQVVEDDPSGEIPALSQIINYLSPKQQHPKFILVKNDESIIQLPFSRKIDLAKFINYKIIATGNYNTCSNSLKISDPKAIEDYNTAL